MTHPSSPAGIAEEARADSGLASIETAIEHLRRGRPVVVVDDESRENEGDVVLSAELASQQWLAWAVRVSSGFVCAPMTNEIADGLDLPPMVAHNEDARGTAYTVSVDAAAGVTTGISASDRATTLRTLAAASSVRDDLHRPGHILPLRARDGGVRERDGHTEASVDLMRAAGLRPVAVISEIVADDGEMMRLPGLLELGRREGVPVVTIAQLIEWLGDRDLDGVPAWSPTSTTSPGATSPSTTSSSTTSSSTTSPSPASPSATTTTTTTTTEGATA